MGIRISEINIKTFGPISNLQCALTRINLFYGKNESGKTYLVEFLIQSLFKEMNYPGMRNLPAVGQVSVSGLGKADAQFSPTTKKKLEDRLTASEKTIPTNVSRLLVVRAGELSMVDDAAVGIDRSILEEYLSNTGLINSIRSRIPVTVQKAIFKEGKIQGSNLSWIKDYQNAKDGLQVLDQLMTQVNLDYSTGYRASIQRRLRESLSQLKEQENAKRYSAYRLHQEIQALQQKIETVPDVVLQQAVSSLDEYRTKSETLKSVGESCQAKTAGSQEFLWLKAALEEYQKLVSSEITPARTWLLVLAGIFLAGSILLALVRQPYLASGAVLAGSALGFLYILGLKKASQQAGQNAEMRRLTAEFQQKFSRPLSDIASLRQLYDEQQEAAIAARTLAGQMEEIQAQLNQLEQGISDNLFELIRTRPAVQECPDKLQEIMRALRGAKEKLEQKKLLFASLQIEAEDFRSEPSSVEYQDARSKQLAQEVVQLEKDLRSEDERLNSLRQRLAQETRLDISTTWEKLIETLQDLRLNTQKRYQELAARLLAGIVVNTALDTLYQEEEKSIFEGLRSSSVTGHLLRMTTHYQRIEYTGSSIRVADPFSEYNFADLSTATQEQILLALRLGFSSHCFSGQSMFLVLDDAFQHSDWTRREKLVDEMLNIADKGWQIIYLTMDDHLRGLFQNKAEQRFPGEFRMFNL